MKTSRAILFLILIIESCSDGIVNTCIESYDIVNGDTINFTDSNCVCHGHWEYINETNIHLNRTSGDYLNGRKIRTWTFYNKDNQEVRKEEYREGVLMKETEFLNGTVLFTKRKTFISFLMEYYLAVFGWILLGSFWLKTFLNSYIYDKMEGTHFFTLFFLPYKSGAIRHSLRNMLTFKWTLNVHDKLRIQKTISNILSLIFVILLILSIMNIITEAIINAVN